MPAKGAKDPTVPDLAASLIRTWVPVGVGAVLAWVATHWPAAASAGHLSGGGQTAITALAIAAYYGLARALEHWPVGGTAGWVVHGIGRWMLGGVVPPSYTAPPAHAAAEHTRRR